MKIAQPAALNDTGAARYYEKLKTEIQENVCEDQE
jgi:hypothetical protein